MTPSTFAPQTIVLPNGLTLVIEENHFAPVVAFQAWVRVGSANERSDEAGLAHVLEHMLFKGTAKRGVGEIARDVEDAGGDINAWTSHDETVFHLVVPAHEAARGLDILADAVQHPALDKDELARELEVILEEIKRGDDSPQRLLSDELFKCVFTKHPYKDPVIGTVESVSGTTREILYAFYARHYTPPNVTVVVVGDFEASAMRAAVGAAFAEWRGELPPKSEIAVEPLQTAPRLVLKKEAVKQVHLSLSVPALTLRDPALPALETLSIVLGQGESGRLIHLLERDKALVNEVGVFPYAGVVGGLFAIDAELPPRHLREVLVQLGTEWQRIRREPISTDELSKAKTMAESEAVYGMQTMQGKARRLGYSQALAGDAAFLERYLEALRALSGADVQKIAQDILDPARFNLVVLWPKDLPDAPSEAELAAKLAEGFAAPLAPGAAGEEARNTAPAFAPALDTRVVPPPDANGIVRLVLPDGLRVLYRENRSVPLVTFQAGWLAGLRAETEQSNGAHTLISRLLTLGTRSRTAREVALETDRLAGQLDGYSGRMVLGLKGTWLARHAARGFELFAECLSEPAFDPDEVEKEKDFLIEEIESKDENPALVAFELFNSTLYREHPFKRPLLGRVETARSFTSQGLRAIYDARRAKSELVVSVVGDWPAEEALAHIERAFAAWPTTPIPAMDPIVEPPLAAIRQAYKPLEREQQHVVLGFFAPTLGDPVRYAFEVLNATLAGQGGRLFVNLRDRESLAYSVSSYHVSTLDTGVFAVYIGTGPEKREQAIASLRRELARLLSGDLSQGEIDYAKRYLIGSQAIHLQTNSAHSSSLTLNELYTLGYDEHLRYGAAIERVTLEEVLWAARRTITPDLYALAEVGPAKG